MKSIAAIFVPLGFIGGLTMGSIWIALGSALFWAVVYLAIKN